MLCELLIETPNPVPTNCKYDLWTRLESGILPKKNQSNHGSSKLMKQEQPRHADLSSSFERTASVRVYDINLELSRMSLTFSQKVVHYCPRFYITRFARKKKHPATIFLGIICFVKPDYTTRKWWELCNKVYPFTNSDGGPTSSDEFMDAVSFKSFAVAH